LILYDGVCGLCYRLVRTLAWIDRRRTFSFAPLQGETGQALAGGTAFGEELDTLVYLREAGTPLEQRFFRSSAVIEIFRDLGFPWSLLTAFGWIPGPWRDGVYAYITRHRYPWFGRFDTCPRPTENVHQERFLP